MRRIELFDRAGACLWGKVRAGGLIDLYDPGNNAWHGTIRAGSIELWDHANRRYSGKIRADNRIDLYDEAGNAWHGRLRN